MLPKVTSVEELQRMATQVRRDVLRMVYKARSGHVGGAMGCADLFAALYFNLLQHRASPFSMEGKGEDLFFLSNGHICAAWYSVLARSGYFPLRELRTFRHINSRLQGHPATAEGLPGVRIASGSLGQGLSVAIGAAQAKTLQHDPQLVYVLMGDGEQQEGQIWEAAMYAAHHQVDNLIAIIDYNGQQIDGPVDKILSLGNLRAKYEAFGWRVLESHGNDMRELLQTLQLARNLSRKKTPLLYLMRTEMGRGVDFMSNDYRWHGTPPNPDQFERAMAQLEETVGDF